MLFGEHKNKIIYILSNLLIFIIIIYLSLYFVYNINYRKYYYGDDNIVEGYNEPKIIHKNLYNEYLNNIKTNTYVRDIDNQHIFYILQNGAELDYNLNKLQDFIGRSIGMKMLLNLETLSPSVNKFSLFRIYSNMTTADPSVLNDEYDSITSIKSHNRYLEIYLEKVPDISEYIIKMTNNNEDDIDLENVLYKVKQGDIVQIVCKVLVNKLGTSDSVYHFDISNPFSSNNNTNVLIKELTDNNQVGPNIFNFTNNENVSSNVNVSSNENVSSNVNVSSANPLEKSVGQISFNVNGTDANDDAATLSNTDIKINLLKFELMPL